MNRLKVLTLAVVCSVVLAIPAAEASTIALQGFSGGALAISGGDQLYGWQFNVLSSVTVTGLGMFDDDNDGNAVAHDVGIFRLSDSALLTSVTIGAGTPGALASGFRYLGVVGPTLVPGAYVIAMTMPVGNGDRQWILTNSVVTASEIQYVTSRFGNSSSLALPDGPGAFAEGMFGPNFQFDAAAAASVPEPASLLLLGTGLAVARRWRRSA